MFSVGVKSVRPVVATLIVALVGVFAVAQTAQVRSRVTSPVSGGQLVTLHGGVHPLARAEFDQGEAPDATPAARMMLVLQRSPEQETALRTFLEQQQMASSPQYHQWLTPEAFGKAYGPSDGDISALTAWLAGNGFSGVKVNAGRTVIEFSGTAGGLKSAFHTSLHNYLVKGTLYTANANDPKIPAALAPVVAGFASLNNFPRKAENRKAGDFRRDNATGKIVRLDASGKPVTGGGTFGNGPGGSPDFTFTVDNDTEYGITPYDFATIYNVTPLWTASSPIDGTGEVVAIAGRTDINPVDFINFRTIFGLPVGKTTNATGTSYLNIIYNGPNPGINGDEPEADIDTQWSSAVAKGATIDFVTSADSLTTFGIDLSAQYIIDNNLAPVMSTSYGACELELGTSGNLLYLQLWEQASAQGITAMVSSGDSGTAGCEQDSPEPAQLGDAVSGYASTPFNVAVGGTDFDIPNGGTAYFSSTNNGTTEASAKSYIPEIPWNDSCANPILALFSPWVGDTPEAVCNNTTAIDDGLASIGGGSGGPSNCISSNGSTVSSCTGGYAKPSWQTGTGVPADGVRDIPDVSLFASNGFLGAFYIICEQDATPDNTCNVNSPYEDFEGYGGTSVASPAFAGIMAMVNEKTGSRQGNANYVLYKLFNAQVTAGTSCASSSSATPASTCTFNDVTTGSIQQPCYSGSPNCTVSKSGDAYGILNGGLATVGYDTAVGLGSVNANNLVNNWASAALTATTTTLTLTPTSVVHGTAVTAGATVKASSGTPTGNVSFNGASPNGSVLFGTLTAGAYSTGISNFPGGTYTVTAHYGGSSTYAESDSTPVSLTVTPESSVVSVTPEQENFYTGAITTVSGTVAYGSVDYVSFLVKGVSGQGEATGDLTVKDNGVVFDGGVIQLNSTGGYDDYSPSLTPGTHSITASYGGDASFKSGSGTSATFTVTKAPTTGSLSATPTTVSTNATLTLGANFFTTSFGYYSPTGNVTFMAGSKVLGTVALSQSYDPATYYDESYANLVIPASALTVGSNTITAVYGGDTNYTGSTSSSVSVTVTQGTLTPSVTTVTVSPTTFTNGGVLAITIKASPSEATATSDFILYIDGVAYGPYEPGAGVNTIQLSGVLSGLPEGQNPVYAVYSGDAHYAASTSAVVYFTVPTPTVATTTAINLSATTVVQGAAATATATVTSSAATGSVQLILDGNVYGLGTAIAGGTATVALPTSTLQVGTHSVAFLYSGDSTYLSSQSPAATLTITPFVTTATTTSVSLNPVSVAQGVTSVATVTVTPAAATGTLQLVVDGLNSGSPITFAGGSTTVNISTTTLSVGTHTIAFTYSGSSSYVFSTGSATLTVTVNLSPTFTLTATPPATATATAPGQISTGVTLTVAPVNSFTGTVSLACTAGLPYGTACVFTPTTVTTSGTTVLTFTTTAPSAVDGIGGHTLLILGGGPVALACFGLLFVPRRRRPRLVALLGMGVLLIGAATMMGCGSSSAPNTGTSSGGTPVGSSGVTVTATSGSITQTATVTLTVN